MAVDQGGTMLWKRVRHCVVFGGKIIKPKRKVNQSPVKSQSPSKRQKTTEKETPKKSASKTKTLAKKPSMAAKPAKAMDEDMESEEEEAKVETMIGKKRSRPLNESLT